MTFIDRHFDKLLLTFIFLAFLAVGAVSVRVGSERGIEWAKSGETLVTGAIIALATGRQRDKGNPPQ